MLGDNLGWGEEGGERGAQDEGYMCLPMANSCCCMAKPSHHYKVIILQLKQIGKKQIKASPKHSENKNKNKTHQRIGIEK